MPEQQQCTWACLTHTGNVRANNEDSMVVLRVEDAGTTELENKGTAELPPKGFVGAVADGMGGVGGGELASGYARTGLLEDLGGPECPHPEAAYLQELINTINYRILGVANDDPELAGMGTTLTLGWFRGDTLTMAHVGDSRLYRFRKGALEQLSDDQSPVGRLLREGRITNEEAREHPHRNVIDQAVGSHSEGLEAAVVKFPVKDGDLFLFCSDGLNEELWDHEMAEAIQEAQRTGRPLLALAEDLVGKALIAGGKDNVTVVLVQVHQQESAQ